MTWTVRKRFVMLLFKLILMVIFLCQIALSYELKDQDPIQYRFVDDGSYSERLAYTIELMSYLKSEYSLQIKQSNMLADFNWNFDWKQDHIGAGSNFYDGQFSIMLYGGYVRATGSTFELIALTLCHELGHYLGGTPRQRLYDKNKEDWSSSEGQSDWFAAHSCLPKVYQYFNKNSPQKLKVVLNDKDKDICALVDNTNENSLNQCRWIMSAGLNFADFVRHYTDRSIEKPSLSAVSPEKPLITLHSQYPSVQCRLDTFRVGALCSVANNKAHFCIRPRCWFNPDRLF